MAVRDTLQIGHPKLKAENQTVNDAFDQKIQQVITDLVDTMRANDLIGMAAPQIGENYRIFVTEPRETPTRSKDQSDILRIYLNPIITLYSPDQIEIWEGCGCVANGTIFAPVTRPKIITIEATDKNSQKFRLKSDGILGRVIQHEYDHLSGIEFTEKITDLKRIISKEFYISLIKPRPEVQKAGKINFVEATFL
jgi:peptide deformylase